MSWLCSRALAEVFSAGSSSGGVAFAPSKSSPIAEESSRPDKTTGRSSRFQSGTTCKRLTEILGAEKWISSLEASRAKILARPERELGLRVRARVFGQKWPESLARLDRVSSLWKTAPSLFGEVSTLSRETWPRSGIILDGALYRLPMLERLTFEKESGFLVGTPTASDKIRSPKFSEGRAKNPRELAETNWPTPTASEAPNMGSNKKSGPKSLTEAANYGSPDWEPKENWPTPTISGNYNQKGASKKSGDGLETAVKKYPTQTASDYKGARKPEAMARTGRDPMTNSLPDAVEFKGPVGRLNPRWVEWLMGWPIGHTKLEPLETDKFQEWSRSHGIF